MKRWTVRLTVLGLLASSAAASAGIVIAARRSEDMPRLVLSTGGPVGNVRGLAFSPDSRRLYAGGMDKAVHVWEMFAARGANVQNADVNATLVRTLRWEIARGQRGSIYSMAVSPTDGTVAIGGFAARDSFGDILINDPTRDIVVASLRNNNDRADQNPVGHTQPITGLSYSSDGKLLVSASNDGEVRIWKLGAAPTSVQVRPPAKTGFFPQPIAFLRNDRILFSQRGNEAGTTWNVAIATVSPDGQVGPAQALTEGPHSRSVNVIAVDPMAEQFATADGVGNVILWTGFAQPKGRLLRFGRIATAMTFGPRGTLFVGNQLDQNNQAVIEVFATADNTLVDQVEASRIDAVLAIAVSPDGRWVGYTAANASEIDVAALADRNGNPIANPLSGGRQLTLGGRGRKVTRVAFSADGSYKFGYGQSVFQLSASPLNSTFDPKKLYRADLTEADANDVTKWMSIEAPGWAVERQNNGAAMKITEAGVPRGQIVLDLEAQGRAWCHCWLRDEQGKPYALAVGTDGQYGVYIYRVSSDGNWPLIRYYRDHTDWVSSLSVSKDGKYLASGSADQTIKIWSLDGLSAVDVAKTRQIGRAGPSFALMAAWGANFERTPNGVALMFVNEAGIAAQRGLRKGDVIVEGTFGRTTAAAIGKQGETLTTNNADEILAALSAGPITESVLLTVQRQGKPLNQRFLIVPAWEPLATFFDDKRGEWAYWTPQGYYAASVHGDNLFGWLINRGAGLRPDYFRADQFRNSMERTETMKRLLTAGTLPAALRLANDVAPWPLDRAVAAASATIPLITILDPADGHNLGEAKQIKVVARVTLPDGSTLPVTPRAFVNGVPLKDPLERKEKGETTLEWTVTPSDAFNRVRVTAYNQAPTETAGYASRDIHVRALERQDTPKLHILALAAAAYPGDLKLDYPLVDAASIIEKLNQGQKGLYAVGTVKKLFDKDINKESVSKLVDEFQAELTNASPADLVVVFIAGHGVAYGGDYFFIPPDPNLKDLDPSKAEEIVRRFGVPWKKLRMLAQLPCRKVFFLDTCYSGNILLADGALKHLKAAVRPLSRDEVFVIAATAEDQPALESSGLGHGVFTKCLLDGLSGAADQSPAGSSRGEVDLASIATYLEKAVPKMTGRMQTPRSSPVELMEMVFIPVAKYKQ